MSLMKNKQRVDAYNNKYQNKLRNINFTYELNAIVKIVE